MWWSKQKSRVTEGQRTLAAPMIMSLEPRMLFDGAVAATVADTAAAQPDSHPTADAAKAPTADHPVASKDTHGQADATPAASPVAVPGQSVVFVDARVKDADSLLKGVAPGTQVVKLDAGKDGLQQIADYLDQHQGVSSVQIIAHGNAGDLWLGNSYLSADNVAQRSAILAEIGKDMNVGGDILIYGCYTAEGDRGLSFVDSLAQLTGRDVAASNNRTGVGGDWDLEIATGNIESANVLSTQAMSEYQWGLATWTATNNANTGVGSLRAALASAQNGDIVTFSSGMTVQLTSELLINKNITVDGDLNNDGVADVTLDGQYRTRVVEITSGSTVTLDGLVITRGLVSGNGGNGGYGATGAMGGGIFNAGILTLNNVSVTSNAAAGGGGGGGVTSTYSGGAGGGGGGLGGQGGGHGGSTGSGIGTYGGQAGSGGVGGYGGGFDATNMGGRGGASTGGAGGLGTSNYSNGGNGGTASNGTISIGGGGGGAGWDKVGGAGGNAAGGIYNASTGTLKIVGTSVISNNLGAGGGGGGGGGFGSNASNGGIAGRGVGAIWNQGGTVLITAANFATISGNAAGSGAGGVALGGGTNGTSPTAVAAIFNNGGTLNTAYVEPPTATIVMSDTALKIGETSLVTITFSRAVTGFTNADLTIANGTLTSVSSSDGGLTWTATFTPTNNITDSTNLITLDNTGVTAISDGVAGVGTTSSVNYAIDTARPTVTIVMSDTALKIGDTSLVTFTFSEAVTGFTNADLTIANGTLSAVSSSDGGITWTGTFTPTASITDTTNLISLDKTGIADLAGNAGSGTTDSANYVIDTVRPTATIVVADANLAVGETSLVTITFSEAVSGFTTADMTVANGTLTGLSSSDGGITWTATLTPTSSITDTTNLVTLDNTGVVDLAGNAGSGTTNSNNYAIDTVRPTATIVVADNALKVGETSLVTITFSEAITGFTNADLTIANGTLTAVSSSDGGITWTATFTPTASITDATNLITLNNTSIADLNGNAGSGTTDSNNYAIDTVRPTATIVVADNNLRIGETSLVTITFSEAVSGFTNADLTIASGTLSAVSSSDGGITWTATFTPSASVTDTTNLITLDNTGIVDLSGNAGSGTTDSNNYAIDTVRPTATIVVADSNLTAGETSLVTITFSEAVSGFTNADLIIANGTLTAVSSSDGGITWTATFTPNVGVNDATNLIVLANTGIADLSGNAGSGTTNSNNYTIDTVVPTATIIVSDPSLKIGETSLVTITFSEAVTGFTNADLTIANGTLSAVSSSDGGITWTATFTPTTNITDATNLITLDNSGIQNLSGNAGSGTTDSNNYSIDTVRPTATIVVADTALGVGQTSLVTITFSEAVTGFTNADLTIANGTLSAVSSSDGGITWTATFTPAAGITDTTNVITLDNTGISDLAGNAGTGTTDSNNYAVDSQRPTATIVMTDSDLRPGETALVTITFSEAVTGFDNSDLSVANGTLSNVSSSDGGITWTATFTPNIGVTDLTNLIVLNNTGITDLAGNTGTGITSSANYQVQTQVPTATIVVADTSLKAGETSLVTITFNEAVSGFDNSDLTIANGTLSNVSSSDGGITWTATFTPTNNITDSSNLITLNNAGVANLSGNSGVGTTDSNNFAIDTALPTATIVVADNRLGIGETTTVTITFSEAVSGFDLSDISVANGSLSNLTSSDGGVTWTATFTPTANVNDPTNLILIDTAGVQDLAGNLGASIAISNNYTLDATRPTVNIVVANPHLGIGQSTTVTFTFSEAVSNFDLSDLSVTNGDLSNLTSSDGGKTWTATFTPTANVTDPSNFIALDTSNVTDLAGNAGSTVAVSNNYALDSERPTATVVIANPNLGVGQTSQVIITFNEAVSGFDLSDLSVANGTLSNLSSSDGGKTWTATLTPNANVNSASNEISINTAGVSDLSGNSGSGVSSSGNYVINTVPVVVPVPPTPPTPPVTPTSPLIVVTPDPEFRSSDPVAPLPPPNVPLQPIVFTAPTGDLGSPLTFAPLFEQRVIGNGIRPLGDIFINRGALSPSFIAQVFTSSDNAGDGSGHGFLGFGGGDGGVFGSSTLSSLFNQDSSAERDSLNAFDRHSIKGGDISQGLRGVFGAPTLGQQLQQIKDSEQHRVDNLAAALQQVGISEMRA
ncbi:Ig-like domain-containing protein [Pseudomonas koreensis]|uniref:Ig-like domain-containing protein n=1 Tax=Pseudomonas koreensis TaxID=198620 RepID=UPI0021C79D26|nr:Ig-like domain-containing protein [Pseudomonas koreensis]MCU0075187.1 Ig-like domain-containing protein [Pseudomonas koreensis]